MEVKFLAGFSAWIQADLPIVKNGGTEGLCYEVQAETTLLDQAGSAIVKTGVMVES